MLFTSFAKLMAVLVLAALSAALSDQEIKKSSVLVVYDPVLGESPESLVSRFGLDPQRYYLGFLNYTNEKLLLVHNKKLLYEHVVFLPSAKKSSAAKGVADKQKLLEYFKLGGNILAVGSAENSVPESIVKFLNEAGIYPAPKGYSVRSFFANEVSLLNKDLVSSKVVSSIEVPKYSGSAALISNSELLLPIIKAPKLSFSANPKTEILTSDKTWTNGEQGFLAVGLQGLSNSRAAWVGSLDAITRELIKWVFQEKSVLKLQFTKHYKTSEPEVENRTLYRINDEVSYSVGVSELQNNNWVPYKPASEDDVLQLSFTMLDPYQRLNLTLVGPRSSTDNGPVDMNVFSVDFTIPDHHGMFTFDFDYKREGLSFLVDKKVVAVRHLANDEYKRSWDITNAWVYIISASLVVIAWLLLVTNFLFLGDSSTTSDVKQKDKKSKDKFDSK